MLEAIEENSPDARIFVLVHKMDLVAVEDRETILQERERLISESCLSCGVENFQASTEELFLFTQYHVVKLPAFLTISSNRCCCSATEQAYGTRLSTRHGQRL